MFIFDIMENTENLYVRPLTKQYVVKRKITDKNGEVKIREEIQTRILKKNPNIVDDETRAAILAEHEAGRNKKTLCAQFGISYYNLNRILPPKARPRKYDTLNELIDNEVEKAEE